MKNKSISSIFTDWFLFDKDEKNDKPVSTFIPQVLAEIQVHKPHGLETHIRVRLNFINDQSKECTIPLKEIESVNWFQKDKRCLFNPNYRKAKKYVANIIRRGMHNAPIEEHYYLGKLGIHYVGKEVVFVAGDRVITRSPDNTSMLNIKIEALPFKLDFDPNLSAKEAFDGMSELINLSPEIGKVLVAHVISGITRAAFKEAGITPCTVLVIVGKTGMLKSHYVPHIAQLYNRNDEIRAATRFNSTQRFIEDILYDYAECTAVIDDLHTAESRGIKRTNEATAEEIIRRIGDDTGRGHKEGNVLVQKKFRGNVVFIGEYTIGKESTVPRALVVNLTVPPNSGILDKYQRHQPLLVSTFYYYFIRWYVENFNDIRDKIDEQLTKFRGTFTKGVHLRLKDTQFYLRTSYMLFLEFCKDFKFFTVEEVQTEYLNFGYQLANLIKAQQTQIKSDGEKPEKTDYLKLIRKLYKNDKFRLTDNVKQFDLDKHDGLIHYGCLCLRGEKLDKIIRKNSRGFNHKNMISKLLDKDALKLVSERYTVQIKQLKGLRFYAIWLDVLD